MTWFAFHGHPDIEASGVEEKTLVGYGFHGYATKQLADQNPNSVNLLQEAFLKSLDASNATRGAAGAGIGAATGVGDFLSRLTSPNTWIRVGEFLAGMILLYIGLNALARGTPVQTASNTATGAAKKVATHVVPV
jgi:hypothetical protein